MMHLILANDPLGLGADELGRRVRRMLDTVVIGDASDGEFAGLPMIIPCAPVDMERLLKLTPDAEAELKGIVSVRHVKTECQVCDQEMWIGPTQAKAKGQRMCYECYTIVEANAQVQPDIRALNPDADEVPRMPL